MRQSMNDKSNYKRITLLIPVVILIFYLISDKILMLMSHIPPCLFNSITHSYCPACGNTRSVTALLHGDILTALRFNIVPIILLILLLLAYIELATYSFSTWIKLVPRKLSFYLTLITLLVIYFIARNFISYLTP